MTVLAVVATTRAAAELQLGGNVGFGMTLRKQAGLFAWDWDLSRGGHDVGGAQSAAGLTR